MKARKRRRTWTATGWVPSPESLIDTVRHAEMPGHYFGICGLSGGMWESLDDCLGDMGDSAKPIQRRITVTVEDV